MQEELKNTIRIIQDFPTPGVSFKDITPIFASPDLCNRVVEEMINQLDGRKVDAVVGVESRGFFFGFLLALRLNVPFYPIRKKGKLPYKTYSESYELEYGKAAIEIHQDTIEKGMQVLVHDDLLATGGTMQATAKLIQAMGRELVGFSFIVALDQLKGIDKLLPYSSNIHSLVHYPI